MFILVQLLLLLGLKVVSAGGLKGFEGCTDDQKAHITVGVTVATAFSKLTP